MKRRNFMAEPDKVRVLRPQLRASIDSEEVRVAIDRELATRMGLNALKKLREFRAIEDFFNRVPCRRK